MIDKLTPEEEVLIWQNRFEKMTEACRFEAAQKIRLVKHIEAIKNMAMSDEGSFGQITTRCEEALQGN